MLVTVLSATKTSNSQFCPEEDQRLQEQMDQWRCQGHIGRGCEGSGNWHNTGNVSMEAREGFQRSWGLSGVKNKKKKRN